MATRALLIRWSWRDLRARWVLVTAIALVIALGTGMFAALQSMTAWRWASNDASFAALGMHDLRVRLHDGLYVDQGALVTLAAGIDAADQIAATQERLLVPTQVDASTGEQTILVGGQLVGTAPDAAVDRVHVFAGDDLADGVVLDVNFARHYDLPPTGTVQVSGGATLGWVGHGVGPEYVFITGGQEGGLFAEAQHAVLFTPLATAQRASGHPGKVNDLVLTVVDGADRDLVEAQLTAALDTGALGATGQVLTRDDDPVYSTLYEDIGNDQKVMSIMAALILAGAAFAAFNLTTRIVEAQRREIGIGMALGASPRLLALRPLLVGVQIAAVGAVAGLGLGYLMAGALGDVMEEFVPLPVWRTDLDLAVFLQAALIGLVLPVVGTAVPVWRAVHIQPVDAIRTSYLTATGVGRTGLAQRLRVPGARSWWDMPMRNILRTPRRTVLTALGIGASITTLVAILGMLDTYLGTLHDTQDELERVAADRVVVELDGYVPVDDPLVQAVVADDAVGRAEPGLRVGALAADGNGDRVELLIELLDLDTAMWTPTLVEGQVGEEPGLVLSRKAADDLAVGVGDTVSIAHPRLLPDGSVQPGFTRLPVAAIHPSAMRFAAYLDLDDADVFGMEDVRNLVTVLPADGAEVGDVQRALFGLRGVGAVAPVAQLGDVLEDFLGEVVAIFQVTQVAVLLLALLIAFNSSSITIDERAREHATMFAFGLRLRTVVAMITVESIVTGILGTIVGLGLGWAVLLWIVHSLLPATVPQFGLVAEIGLQTVATAAALGIVAVAIAPLATVRRLRRMDLPSTLRLVE